MDFRKELAKELKLGAIAENTMLDDYVKACEAIAVRYHESKVKKFHLGAVSGSALSAAFDVIFTMDDFLGNVIATGDPTNHDLVLKEKCEKYIMWYKKNYR